MCGIAGALDLTGFRDFSADRLRAMTDAIAHRGPDDAGWHFEPGVALGARRLAIVDLDGGRQPIANEDRSVWVAFNGELFEYPELRRGLLGRGHRLATRCDTEAWVHLYEDNGLGMFEKARGQFAVSLWDRKSRELILGRDRVGICPLYYAERDGWLLWASEVKALLASGLVEAKPDVKGVDHLFSFFCAGTSRTFFEGVRSVPPGHFLKAKDGRVSPHQYWDLDFPDDGDERRVSDASVLTDELEGLLRQSVERRLRGDVPVVSYISGGLDSTVVLGLTRRERGEAVPSFTVGFDRAGPDERDAAAEAAGVLGSKLTVVALDRHQIASAFPELITAVEGPVLDTSSAALLRLASAVHDQGYKVVLTGEGADEALAGYVWYKAQKARNRLGARVPRLLHRGLMASVGKNRRTVAESVFGGTRPAQLDMYELVSRAQGALYAEGMWDRLNGHDPYDDLDLNHERMRRWHPLNQSLYLGYKVMLAGLLLISKGDRVAMHNSVETRYPFLDDDVIKFCSEIAPEYKLHGWTEKWLLRRVAERTLPPRIANRPKTMFRSNLSKTFLGRGRPAWIDQLLSPESLRKTGYFDPRGVAHQRRIQGLMPRVTPARGVFDVGLTCVVTTQLWHHIYCGGGLCDLPSWRPNVPSRLLGDERAEEPGMDVGRSQVG